MSGRKTDVATLVFGRSKDVRSIVVTTLWQLYPTSRPKYNQNLMFLQRRVPAGLLWQIINALVEVILQASSFSKLIIRIYKMLES